MKRQKSVKILSMLLSVFALMLSNLFPVYAKSTADITPYDYLFLMTFAACGIRTDHANGKWIAAYKGYLKSINDTAMLNQLSAYDNLFWGDTATHVDDLYNSIKQWLSLSPDYGTMTDFYTLPTLPSAQTDKVASGGYSVCQSSFADVNPIPLPDCDFLFANVYSGTSSGRNIYTRANYYIPSGVEVFGVVSGVNPYVGEVSVKILKKDSSSATGYTQISLNKMSASYYYDNDVLVSKSTTSATSNFVNLDLLSVSNLPFMVFGNFPDAEVYAKTGVVNHVFSDDACSIWCYNNKGVNLDLHANAPFNFGDTVKLPSSNADAVAAYNATHDINVSLDNVADNLKSGGFSISRNDVYTVEHYKQSADGKSWMVTDVETLSGLPGQSATYTAKSYEGFTFNDSFTTPDDPLIADDGSLIIRLYYSRNSIDYKVEHYQQNLSGDAWTKMDTDNFTGLYGTTASCPAKSYTGFICDTSLTVPDNLQLSNNKMTIKLYYRRISIDYTVNHYQQDLKDDSWTLVDTDALTGLYGADVKYTLKEYPGYACDTTLTQLPSKILKEPLMVDLYYTRKKIAYTVEHYKGREKQDTTIIDWMLAEKETLSGIYGTKATYEYKSYTDYPYDARLTKADNLELLNDNEVVIKLYYVKPFGVGVIEDMVNSVADFLVSAAWAGLGFITTGIVGLYCVKLYKNTVLQAVGYDKDLGKKAKATPGNMPKSKMSMRDKAMLKPSTKRKKK